MTLNEFIKISSPFIIGGTLVDEDKNNLEKSSKELDIWDESNLSSSKLLGLDLSSSQSPNNSFNISNYLEENSFDNSSTTSINIANKSNENMKVDNEILENTISDKNQSLYDNITIINKPNEESLFSSKNTNKELNNSSFDSIDIPLLASASITPNKSMDKSNLYFPVNENKVDLTLSNNVSSTGNDMTHVVKKSDPWASSSNKKQSITNDSNLNKTNLDIITQVDEHDNNNKNILDSLKQSSSPKGIIINEKKIIIEKPINQDIKENILSSSAEVLPTSIEDNQIELTNESKKIRHSNPKLTHTQKLISSISASNTDR